LCSEALPTVGDTGVAAQSLRLGTFAFWQATRLFVWLGLQFRPLHHTSKSYDGTHCRCAIHGCRTPFLGFVRRLTEMCASEFGARQRRPSLLAQRPTPVKPSPIHLTPSRSPIWLQNSAQHRRRYDCVCIDSGLCCTRLLLAPSNHTNMPVRNESEQKSTSMNS